MEKQYTKFFEDEEINQQKEFESKQAKKSIKWLKDNRANNYDSRVEFAKNIFQLSLSSDKEARKFIKKLSQFLDFYGDDNYISEEEWRKLNNSEGE